MKIDPETEISKIIDVNQRSGRNDCQIYGQTGKKMVYIILSIRLPFLCCANGQRNEKIHGKGRFL